MPDPDKLRQLGLASYAVRRTCGNCVEGRFAPGLDWGSCQAMTYVHAKHGERQLSVNRHGHCPGHTLNEKKAADLKRSGFDTFLEN